MPSGHKRSSPYEQPAINPSLSIGTSFGWYDNGQMYEYARYGDDWQMIERVSWNEKGQKISEALFSDDEKTVGYRRDWYSNGQLKAIKSTLAQTRFQVCGMSAVSASNFKKRI